MSFNEEAQTVRGNGSSPEIRDGASRAGLLAKGALELVQLPELNANDLGRTDLGLAQGEQEAVKELELQPAFVEATEKVGFQGQFDELRRAQQLDERAKK